MNGSGTRQSMQQAAGFEQPLVLTFGQDVKGFVFRHLGRLALFVLTCTSVLAVFFIFLFVILEAFPFLGKFSIIEFLTSKA